MLRTLILALFTLTLGCTSRAPDARPIVELSDAERTPDPTCTGSWIAAITVAVGYGPDQPTHADVQACVGGAEGSITCIAGAQTNRYGWAVVRLPEGMRCVHRAVLKVTPSRGVPVGVPMPLLIANAYKRLDLAPTGGVLDVATPIRIVGLNPPTTRAPLSADRSLPHTIEFVGDVRVTLRPDALASANYEYIGLDRPVAPEFMFQTRRPSMVIVLGPDSELSPLDGINRWGTISLPVTDAEGVVYDASVLPGEATMNGNTQLEMGTLTHYATATVTDHRLTLPLPRIGWIALYRR